MSSIYAADFRNWTATACRPGVRHKGDAGRKEPAKDGTLNNEILPKPAKSLQTCPPGFRSQVAAGPEEAIFPDFLFPARGSLLRAPAPGSL